MIEVLSPFTIQFRDYGDFPPSESKSNGTFFVKPEDESGIEITKRGKLIDRAFKRLKKRLTQGWSIECKNPHMTIGRALALYFIELTYANSPNFSAQCFCNALTLRKFNDVRKQYDVISSFTMGGLQPPEYEQLSLF